MRAEMVEMSMLPPERMAAAFFPLRFSFGKAAKERTPAPSAMSLCFSIKESRADMISNSETVTISSKYLRQKA